METCIGHSCTEGQKVSEFKGHSDLRPISVTSILSRVVEKIIVKKYLWPSLNDEMMNDQFGFRPTGSTACALIYMLHTIYSMFENGNEYVRCILIDYSKAFDVTDHATLLTGTWLSGIACIHFQVDLQFSYRSYSSSQGYGVRDRVLGHNEEHCTRIRSQADALHCSCQKA